jgi:hypothetical protein
VKAKRKEHSRARRAERSRSVAGRMAVAIQTRPRSTQIPAIRMQRPLRTQSQKFSVRFFLGLTVLTGILFSLDHTTPPPIRVAMAIITVIAALAWLGYELMRPRFEVQARREPETRAPATAAFVRWSLLTALLLVEWLLPHPGSTAVCSFVFANVRTQTEKPRRGRQWIATMLMAMMAIAALGRSIAVSLAIAGQSLPVGAFEYASMILCVAIAVSLPELSRRLVRHG